MAPRFSSSGVACFRGLCRGRAEGASAGIHSRIWLPVAVEGLSKLPPQPIRILFVFLYAPRIYSILFCMASRGLSASMLVMQASWDVR